MGEYRDMGNPARVAKKNPALAASPLVQDFFFTTCAGIPMSLNWPMQECSIHDSNGGSSGWGYFFTFLLIP
jgi:hypothetical protein